MNKQERMTRAAELHARMVPYMDAKRRIVSKRMADFEHGTQTVTATEEAELKRIHVALDPIYEAWWATEHPSDIFDSAISALRWFDPEADRPYVQRWQEPTGGYNVDRGQYMTWARWTQYPEYSEHDSRADTCGDVYLYSYDEQYSFDPLAVDPYARAARRRIRNQERRQP